MIVAVSVVVGEALPRGEVRVQHARGHISLSLSIYIHIYIYIYVYIYI